MALSKRKLVTRSIHSIIDPPKLFNYPIDEVLYLLFLRYIHRQGDYLDLVWGYYFMYQSCSFGQSLRITVCDSDFSETFSDKGYRCLLANT